MRERHSDRIVGGRIQFPVEKRIDQASILVQNVNCVVEAAELLIRRLRLSSHYEDKAAGECVCSAPSPQHPTSSRILGSNNASTPTISDLDLLCHNLVNRDVLKERKNEVAHVELHETLTSLSG